MPGRWWLDGVERHGPPPLDRGLHYGDGVFETLAVIDGRVRHLERHVQRLQRGLARLGIDFPRPVDWGGEWQRAAAGQERLILKCLVTRGEGGQGYLAPQPAIPRRRLIPRPWPAGLGETVARGATLCWCATALPIDPRLAGIKHLNRLHQVLASEEWRRAGADEGLMCDSEGWVVEGTRSNLFLVHRGTLLTPLLDRCGVAGVMREAVMERAEALGIPLEARRIHRREVEMADELFLTNAVVGLWPVRALAGRHYPVPGPITRRLREAVS